MKALFATLIITGILFSGTAMAQEADREIGKVKGDVYRFRNLGHMSVFVVTGDGVAANKVACELLWAWARRRGRKPITRVGMPRIRSSASFFARCTAPASC